jgi:hypothetical protein
MRRPLVKRQAATELSSHARSLAETLQETSDLEGWLATTDAVAARKANARVRAGRIAAARQINPASGLLGSAYLRVAMRPAR